MPVHKRYYNHKQTTITLTALIEKPVDNAKKSIGFVQPTEF